MGSDRRGIQFLECGEGGHLPPRREHYRDMQDMELTVEEGTLYMLQTRVGKRTPTATFKMAVDMAKEGLISKEEAIDRIKPEDIDRLFYPIVDPSTPRAELAKRQIAS